MGYPVTLNRMEPGGNRWIVAGTLEKSEGAPVLPTGALQVGLIQHYQIAPDAASATAVHAAVTLADGEATSVTDELNSPDVPRIVTIKGNAAGIAGDVVVTGTNILDQAITETLALNGSSEVLGTKAFKTVTQVDLPALTQEGDTVSVGMGKKFGLPHIVYNAACVLVKLFNGSTDSGSLTVDDDEIEKNIFALNGSPDGSKVLDLYYLI